MRTNLQINSLGIGATNRCNLNCPHCYSRPLPKLDMACQDTEEVLEKYPNTTKINFGTGESILNPDFIKIMQLCRQRNIKMALTTNSFTIHQLSDQHLSWFKDIDISLDFPCAKKHDPWRGQPGLFQSVIKSLDRCQKLKVDTSLALCLMNNNYQLLPEFRTILDRFNICLRLNIYKAAWTDKFSLNYDQFWEAMELLSKHFKLVSNSEPILSIITRDNLHGSPCGEKSARIHPDKTVVPCVYLRGKPMTCAQFNQLKKRIPRFCQKCKYVKSCQGGCLSRRILDNKPDQPDRYCPLSNHKDIPKLSFKRAKEKNFIHAGYLCTIIVK